MGDIGSRGEDSVLGGWGVDSEDLVGKEQIEEDEWSNSSEESDLDIFKIIDLEGAEWGIRNLESGLDIEESVGEDPGHCGDWSQGVALVPVLQVPEEEGVVTQFKGETSVEVSVSVLLDSSSEAVHKSLIFSTNIGLEESFKSIQWVEEGFESGRNN